MNQPKEDWPVEFEYIYTSVFTESNFSNSLWQSEVILAPSEQNYIHEGNLTTTARHEFTSMTRKYAYSVFSFSFCVIS